MDRINFLAMKKAASYLTEAASRAILLVPGRPPAGLVIALGAVIAARLLYSTTSLS